MSTHQSFNPTTVAIAVIGYYPNWYEGGLKNITDTDKIRGDLALEFVRKTQKMGFHLVWVDGGSSYLFLQHLQTIPEIIFEKMDMVVAKRSPKKQRAYVLASQIPGIKAIVSTEAEKTSLLDSVSAIVTPLLTDQADIIIPKREKVLFKKTYPHFQFLSEKQANEAYNQILYKNNLLLPHEEDLDIFFGPIAFQNTRELLELFIQRVTFRKYENTFPSEFHDPDQYSNAYFFPTIMALQRNITVKSVIVNFRYPQIQKQNEEMLEEQFIEKRNLQKEGILSNLHDFLEYRRKNI